MYRRYKAEQKASKFKIEPIQKIDNEQQCNCKALDEFLREDFFNKVPNFFTGF